MRRALHYVSARHGDKYGPEYTEALKKQVPGLVCLGDDRPLQSELGGWWCILEPFAPWNADLRPCVWFDLDTYVFGPLDVFNRLDKTQYWMIDNFNEPKNGECGIMLVPDSPLCDEIWENRGDPKMSAPPGNYLRNFPHRRLNREISGIYSYKNHCRESRPDDARIICFHGQPKPTTLKPGWAKDYWHTITSLTTNC